MCTPSISSVIYSKFSYDTTFYTLNGKNVNIMLELNLDFSYSDSFQEKTEEEWKELEKTLKPVIEEVDEDSENRQSPDSLIGEDETMER